MSKETERCLATFSVCLLLAAGCGGGGAPPSPTGRAAITIQWPDRGRWVPMASNSIQVVFRSGSTTLASRLVPRPSSGGTTAVTFDSLSIGALSMSATAYPNADGTGVAQASGTTPVTIVEGQTAQVALSMQSAIDHLEATPAASSILVGASIPLTMTAKSASGAVVLTWPTNVHWSTTNPEYATVDAAGTLTAVRPTGLTPGPIIVWVGEAESGKTVNVPVTVTSNTTIGITTPPPTLSVGDSVTFSVSVGNAPDTTVDWSVQEGPAAGTISAAGVYTAPDKAGIFHIVATSRYDNAKKATVAVTVLSGNAGVTIQ